MREDWQANAAPAVKPGQIWLIEHSAGALCPLDRAAVAGANVVIYDRTLAPLLAQALPLGSYAEAADARAAEAISPRAIEFATEGWSVVQLVAASPGRRARLQDMAEALIPARFPGAPVIVIAKGALGRHRRWCGHLRELSELIDEGGDGDPLTVIVGPLGVYHLPRAPAFTANGLAG